ncbi:MAG: hypothetical protein Q4B53_06245 [Lachnospiraceae bacterium]|nr:hypothetical protein [Lachnospiraceae bacterium]
MVFKRVLKGIGRLMLTTAVMCGVGLFLCSSEVKATINAPTISSVTDNTSAINSGDVRFTITVENNDANSIKVSKIEFCTDDTCTNTISAVSLSSGSIASSGTLDIDVTNLQFLEGCNINSLSEGTKSIGGVKVTVVNEADPNESAYETKDATISSAQIYKVSAEKATSFSGVKFTPTFKYTVGGRDSQYGYSGESYTISNASGTADNYYMLSKTGSSVTFSASDTEWKDCSTVSEIASGTIGSENVLYKVAYLPKVKDNKLVVTGSSNSGSTLSSTEPKTLGIITNSVNANTTLTYGIGSFTNPQEDQNDTILGYYTKSASVTESSNMASMSANSSGRNGCDVTMQLSDIGTTGTGKVKLAIELGNNIKVASVELPITLSAVTATGFDLQNVPVSIMAGVSRDVPIIKGILPAGANQTLSNYEGIVTETTSTKLLNTLNYDKVTGKVTLEAKSDVTSGTATVQIELKDGATSIGTQSFNVKIISFDKDKTISSINKNNKNYITYNKDKGYSLDIKQLIIDNAKDTSDNTVTITKDQITAVSVGGSSCTDGIWKPSEAALNQKVSCKINGVQISESDGLKVSAYPMPTATYSSSNRTLSVKIPTKVATAYSDDNNIRQSKGFKLILEDSSGNTLYEYTDSKYQNVLSSSSESTVTYTVPAADIEGMVTSAASNGKFSADTTSVKFKVIPMGYKQSSTSDETIKAKDEIAGKTDAVTVYKVSASGTNFTSSAAYGLDGQTVSITATPNSGYSFKQWSDGNTSNPRQVKVSASGTRAFQAVAGDRVANTAGGTDNSELYDDVPKTAESNSAIWLIVFMVFAVMGTTYALYLQLRAANSKHDR